MGGEGIVGDDHGVVAGKRLVIGTPITRRVFRNGGDWAGTLKDCAGGGRGRRDKGGVSEDDV